MGVCYNTLLKKIFKNYNDIHCSHPTPLFPPFPFNNLSYTIQCVYLTSGIQYISFFLKNQYQDGKITQIECIGTPFSRLSHSLSNAVSLFPIPIFSHSLLSFHSPVFVLFSSTNSISRDLSLIPVPYSQSIIAVPILTPLLSPPSLIPPCNPFPSPFSHIQHLSVISLVISKSDDHRVIVWGLHNQAPVLIAMSRSSCRHNKQLRIQLLK